MKRKASVGDELSSYSINAPLVAYGTNKHLNITTTCTLDEVRDSLTIEFDDNDTDDIIYEGDIIVQECTTKGTETYLDMNETFTLTDTYYEAYQKDKGRIALMNENCLVPHTNVNVDASETFYDIDDSTEQCAVKTLEGHLLIE